MAGICPKLFLSYLSENIPTVKSLSQGGLVEKAQTLGSYLAPGSYLPCDISASHFVFF